MFGARLSISPARGQLLDADLVSSLQVDVPGGTRRQLQHAVCAPLEQHDAVPRRQLAIDLPHALLRVEEYGVDGEVHEHHVDAVARDEPHATPWIQMGAKHEAEPPAEH